MFFDLPLLVLKGFIATGNIFVFSIGLSQMDGRLSGLP